MWCCAISSLWCHPMASILLNLRAQYIDVSCLHQAWPVWNHHTKKPNLTPEDPWSLRTNSANSMVTSCQITFLPFARPAPPPFSLQGWNGEHIGSARLRIKLRDHYLHVTITTLCYFLRWWFERVWNAAPWWCKRPLKKRFRFLFLRQACHFLKFQSVHYHDCFQVFYSSSP